MDELLPFVRCIIELPGEAGPRAVLADWLDERGDPRVDWLRFIPRVHELAGLAHDLSHNPGIDEQVMPHRCGRLARLDAAAQLRFSPAGESRTVWQLLCGDRRLTRAVAAAELLACDLLPEKLRRDLYQSAANAAKQQTTKNHTDAADGAVESLALPAELRWRDTIVGSVGMNARLAAQPYYVDANAYHGRLRNLLLREPLPPVLPAHAAGRDDRDDQTDFANDA